MTVSPSDAAPRNRLEHVTQGLTLVKIHDTVADYGTSFDLINRYSPENQHYETGFQAGQWFETRSDVYWHFLECLPPLHQTGGGFVVSECTMMDLYECFFEIDERYFCVVIRWTGPKSFSDLWAALLKEIASQATNPTGTPDHLTH